MCDRCVTLDLRAKALRELACDRDDRRICDQLRRSIEVEILERLLAMDIEDPVDEQL